MTDAESSPMSRRDVWLTIALAVAKGDIPEPCQVDVREDIRVVDLLYRHDTGVRGDARGDAARAAEAFGVEFDRSQPGIDVWWRSEDATGWTWCVRAYAPKPGELVSETAALAEQVIEAIEPAKPPITDPVELGAAYGLPIDWARTCTSCGGPFYDGQCQGAEQCEDPKCTRACCAAKRQGPVAEQRPGSGSN